MNLEIYEFTIVKKHPERKYIVRKSLKKSLFEEFLNIFKRGEIK